MDIILRVIETNTILRIVEGETKVITVGIQGPPGALGPIGPQGEVGPEGPQGDVGAMIAGVALRTEDLRDQIDNNTTLFTTDYPFLTRMVELVRNGMPMIHGQGIIEIPPDQIQLESDVAGRLLPPLVGQNLYVRYVIKPEGAVLAATTLKVEDLLAQIDGVTTLFTVDHAYVAGSMELVRNGQTLRHGQGIIEILPNQIQLEADSFGRMFAPSLGQNLHARYIAL